MAVSHACASCGLELASIRAAPDPHYGLAVVVCPRCRTACTRSRPDIVRWWRSVRRPLRSALLLALQLVILGLLLIAFAKAFFGIESGMFARLELGMGDAGRLLLYGQDEDLAAVRPLPRGTATALRLDVGLFVGYAVATGIWAGATLWHLRVRVLAVLLPGMLGLAVLVPGGVTWGARRLDAGVRLAVETPATLGRLGAAIVVFAVIASAAVPLGRLVAGATRTSLELRRARYRRRRRTQRESR